MTIANSSSAQITDPEVQNLVNEINALEGQVNQMAEQSRSDAINWVSNASCSDLEIAYQNQMRAVDYWSNQESYGTGVLSQLPNTYASMALNSADIIADEQYRRC